VAELLLEVYSVLRNTDAARGVVEAIEAEFPENVDAAAIAAEWRASQPDEAEKALASFYAALDRSCDERQRERITLSLADFYYRNQRFSEAAGLYKNLVSLGSHPLLLQRYVLSLFNSGQHRAALRVAHEARKGDDVLPVVSAIEARLLEEAGDLEAAKHVLRQLVAADPDDPDHRIALAYLHYRSGDNDDAKNAVLGISLEEVQGSSHQLMALARVRAWLGLDGVLELAYRARRLGFDKPEIHQRYISLVLNRRREHDSDLEVERVAPGSTVHLEGTDGGNRVFTVV